MLQAILCQMSNVKRRYALNLSSIQPLIFQEDDVPAKTHVNMKSFLAQDFLLLFVLMEICFYYCSPSLFSYAETSIFAYAIEDLAWMRWFFSPIIDKPQVFERYFHAKKGKEGVAVR